MTRLYLLVEGQTEERFVKDVLAPHLHARGIWTYPMIVETRRDRVTGRKIRGGGSWSKWKRDMARLVKEQRGTDVRFSTLFDLYGLPHDYPEIDTVGTDTDTVRRAEKLQAAMAKAIDDRRLIPYLQRHEFEALVLASLDQLRELLDPADHSGVSELQMSLGTRSPEEINDGETTAPSRRLERHIPSYDKQTYGPMAIELAGLEQVRARCPRFHAWVTTLEALPGDPV